MGVVPKNLFENAERTFESMDSRRLTYYTMVKIQGGEKYMNKERTTGLLLSIVVGVVIALVTGLFRSPLVRMGVDVVYSGMPIAWEIRVIPRAGQILWTNFIIDAAFWVLIILIVWTIAIYAFGRRGVSEQI